MDKIFINKLKIETIIGVLPWEQTQKQPIQIDLEIAVDIQKAAVSKNLLDTLDYSILAQRLTDFIANSKFQLLETLAHEITQLILNEFKAPWLRLQLTKPMAIANAEGAGLIIERKKVEHTET